MNKTKTLQVRVTAEERAEFDALAEAMGKSPSNLLREMVREVLAYGRAGAIAQKGSGK